MKIVDAKVIVCSPGRNFVTLKIVTEDGIYGLGDATLNGRELAVASYLSDHVIPLLIGRDAHRRLVPLYLSAVGGVVALSFLSWTFPLDRYISSCLIATAVVSGWGGGRFGPSPYSSTGQ